MIVNIYDGYCVSLQGVNVTSRVTHTAPDCRDWNHVRFDPNKLWSINFRHGTGGILRLTDLLGRIRDGHDSDYPAECTRCRVRILISVQMSKLTDWLCIPG
jgi:hypothetical protein